MAIPIDPRFILGQGVEQGYEWVISHDGRGYRFGHVKIPPDHPWHERDYDLINARVHGGLTAVLIDNDPGREPHEEPAIWIGFDCAHYNDAPDPSISEEPLTEEPGDGAVIGTQTYVRRECEGLCEQASKIKKEAKMRRFLNYKAQAKAETCV